MALISKIRENTIFVLIFIGLGIALFILMDTMSSNNLGGGNVGLKMGEAAGTEFDRQEFERTLGTVYSGGDAYQNRAALWDFYVSEAMVKSETNGMGLTVSDSELRDLEFGSRPSRIIQQNFADPQTGQLNRQLLTNIQNYIENDNIQGGIQEGQLSPNFVPIWRYQRRQIVAQRLQEKINSLVGKGMYAPSWLAQSRADAQTQTINAAYVKIPFDKIEADVEVTDDAIQAYLEKNRSRYTQAEEQRMVSYIAFDVTPTAADSTKLRDQLNELKAEWESTTLSDSIFANTSNGSYINTFYNEGSAAISETLGEVVYEELAVGDIYGPYVEGTNYRLAKLVDREIVPDSADTRHILIGTGANYGGRTFEEADARVDSLMSVIQRRGRGLFGDLAEEFSDDRGSKDNGGLYEAVTPGQFVKPYDDVIFRTGDLRKLYKVRSALGVHLVEVLSRARTTSPRVKVAYLNESIVPSSETEDVVLERAQQFLADHGENLDALTEAIGEEAGLSITESQPITINGFQMPELGNDSRVIRDIACWAFSADEGDVDGRVYTFTDPALFYENKHVIISLSNVVPEGLASVASKRIELSPIVTNQLKGEEVAGQITSSTLVGIATQFGVEVDTLNNVNLTMTNLPAGAGREPAVVAAIFNTTTQQLSAPIVGETGVFVVMPLNELNTTTSGSMPTARTQMQAVDRSLATRTLATAMRANLEIEDDRASLDCR
ncbi:MAG: peptidylprolyl isomerase [Bacteroidota bacterium]